MGHIADWVRRKSIVTSKRLCGYLPKSEESETHAWLATVCDYHIEHGTYRAHEPRRPPRKPSHHFTKAAKETFTTMKHSDLVLRLRERVYQSPQCNVNRMEMELLSEVLRRILFQSGPHADQLWAIVQTMVRASDNTHFQLTRVLRSRSAALQHVYTRYAEREDDMGSHMAPRAAPAFLAASCGKRTPFGATSWYVMRVACSKAEWRIPVEFDVKVGISDEVAGGYWTDGTPVEKMRIECLTPRLIPDIGGKVRARRRADGM